MSDGTKIEPISMTVVTHVESSMEARQLYTKLQKDGKLNELDVVRLIKTVIEFHEMNGT